MEKMRFMKAFMMAAALVASMGMIACDPEEGPEPPTPPTENVWEGNDLKGNVPAGEISLVASTVYTLSAPLFVPDGATLNIPAGTRIQAAAGDKYILVEMGGRINIKGTASAPVVMTAGVPNAGPGYWGGLVINGRAPLAGGETNVDTEINAAYKYGGTDADDSSGEITYLVLEYTGYAISSSIEHNGLTLNAVGKGTKIENVYIPNGGDDGIEFFGGSVDVTGLLVVNSDDDMFDFTRGYNGTLKNAYGIWEAGYTSSESDPSGIEADGNFDGDSAGHSAQSDFAVENVTFDLRLAYVAGDNARRMQSVMRIRRGATARISNALVKGSGRAETLINLQDGKGGANKNSSVSLTSSLTTAADADLKFCSAEQVAGGEVNDGSSAADYPNVGTTGGNTGCPVTGFAWTGYTF